MRVQKLAYEFPNAGARACENYSLPLRIMRVDHPQKSAALSRG